MTLRAGLRRAVPWALCVICLGMLAVSSALRWVYRDDPVDDLDWAIDLIGSLGFVGFPVVGALIGSRLPASPIGWLWLATGLAYALSDISAPLIRATGWPSWVGWLLSAMGFLSAFGLLVFVFLLFPDGRLPSRRWRWAARAGVAIPALLMLAAPFFDDASDKFAPTPWALRGAAGRTLLKAAEFSALALLGVIGAAMLSLVLRFRRADAVQRRQLAWFLYATIVNAVILAITTPIGLLPSTVSSVVSAAGFAFLPIAVGIAVFRYRLFEIDRIVSRTVSYGLLSAALIALYLLVVALLRPLLAPFTGNSSLAVAASTLAVAAAFNPARRRLQAAVDRQFDRARYDAARAVEDFAARLRSEVDLDEITDGLCRTVTATVAPGRVSVWLRPGEGISQAGR